MTNSNRSSMDLFNLNEYFQPVAAPVTPMVMNGGEQDKQSLLNSQKMIIKQESLININLRLFLDDLRSLPVKIINIVLNVIKSFVETLFYRRTRVSRRSLWIFIFLSFYYNTITFFYNIKNWLFFVFLLCVNI